MAPTIPGFQGIKHCVQYLTSHQSKPILYYSNSYDVSNLIRLPWIGNQVEDYTTHNCLKCHQYEDHDTILNMRRSVSGIIHTLLGISVC